MGGQFKIKQKALVDFKFPDLNHNKMVTWICHVDAKSKREHALYDIIIGMDLMTEIGIYVNTKTLQICWEDFSTPLMRPLTRC